MIWFLCFWLAVIGAAAGSFIDCAVSRWAAGEKWHTGRSRCVACGHTLGMILSSSSMVILMPLPLARVRTAPVPVPRVEEETP